MNSRRLHSSDYYGALIAPKMIEKVIFNHYQETKKKPSKEDIINLKVQAEFGQTLAIS